MFTYMDLTFQIRIFCLFCILNPEKTYFATVNLWSVFGMM